MSQPSKMQPQIDAVTELAKSLSGGNTPTAPFSAIIESYKHLCEALQKDHKPLDYGSVDYYRHRMLVADSAHWYYVTILRSLGLELQGTLRLAAVRLVQGWPAGMEVGQWLERHSDTGPRGHGASAISAFQALLFVCANLRFISYTDQGLRFGPVAPDSNVLVAKLLGLKTGIPGLDALTGGGLIFRRTFEKTGEACLERTDHGHRRGDPSFPTYPRSGRLLVCGGAYGTGKSTFVSRLVLEMVRKGGVAVVATLEKTPERVFEQWNSLGFFESCDEVPVEEGGRQGYRRLNSVKVFRASQYRTNPPSPVAGEPVEEADPCRPTGEFKLVLSEWGEDGRAIFAKTVEEAKNEGVVWVCGLHDAVLEDFAGWLRVTSDAVDCLCARLAKERGFGVYQCIMADPMEAVQLTRGLSGPTEARNYADQVFDLATIHGAHLFLTLGHGSESKETEAPELSRLMARSLSDLADIVVNLRVMRGGREPGESDTIRPPLRTLEIEKAPQRHVLGQHVFRIGAGSGIHIQPAGRTFRELLGFYDQQRELNRLSPIISSEKSGALAHSDMVRFQPCVLSRALCGNNSEGSGCENCEGMCGVPRGFVTAIMGPAGCFKTELGLLFALTGRRPASEPPNRSLFIAFRDRPVEIKHAINSVLKGHMPEKYAMDLLELDVYDQTGSAILDRIRSVLRSGNYDRVVFDSLAYMSITSYRVDQDSLFVTDLLYLLRIQDVTPLFLITEIPDKSKSNIQSQIRDASHTVIEAQPGDRAVELRIRKSHKMDFYKGPLKCFAENGKLEIRQAD